MRMRNEELRIKNEIRQWRMEEEGWKRGDRMVLLTFYFGMMMLNAFRPFMQALNMPSWSCMIPFG
jgi:hypothetical protein